MHEEPVKCFNQGRNITKVALKSHFYWKDGLFIRRTKSPRGPFLVSYQLLSTGSADEKFPEVSAFPQAFKE